MSYEQDLRVEIGTHLRRTHLFLVTVSCICLVVTFAYRDSSIAGALQDHDLLQQAGAELFKFKGDSNLDVIRKRWNAYRIEVEEESALVVTRTGISRGPLERLPAMAGAEGLELDQCENWEAIARAEFSDIQRMLREHLGADPDGIQCRWMGENELLFASAPAPPLESARVVTPRGIVAATPADVAVPVLNEIRDHQLLECGRWLKIQRSEYADIVEVLSQEVSPRQPIHCQWIGEDALLYVPSEEMPRVSDPELLTATGVVSADPAEVSRLGTKRIDGLSLDQCGGWLATAETDYAPYADRLRTARAESDNPEDFACKWSGDAELVAFPVDWTVGRNATIPESLRPLVGKSFEVAFPRLSSFANGAFLEDGEFSSALGDSGEKKLRELQSDLREKLLALDRLSVFGFPLNRSLVVYGGALLIILLQLYFLLHFHQPTARDCVGFPWIGFYTDPLSRGIFAISVVPLPAAALWVLVREEMAGTALGLSIAAAALGSVIALAQGVELVRRWPSSSGPRPKTPARGDPQ